MNKGCPKCGRMVDGNSQTCPYCNYDFRKLENSINNTLEDMNSDDEKYAGFIKRLIAGMIDIYIVLLFISPFFIFMRDKISDKVYITIYIALYILYNSVLERTNIDGSLGKKFLGIEVVDEYENPVTFLKALSRNIVKVFNVITLGIGFIICAAPPYKQTLGDKLSNTYVTNRIKFTEEEREYIAPLYKRFMAFMIDVIYISIIVFIINYGSSYIKLPETIDIKMIVNILSLVIIVFYFPYGESKNGRTRGKKIMGIKVTDYDEEKIGFIRALIRYLLLSLDFITLGFLFPLINKKGQMLKDIVTKTVVINE